VQIGLDGSSDQKNAFYRGYGAFELIKASVINMQKANIKVNLSFCIDKNNVKDVEAMLQFALELGFYKVKITFWRSEVENVDEKHKELSICEKYFITDVCKKFQEKHKLDEWIVSPSPIISEGSLASIHRRALVIKSDGEIALDEFDESIGNIKEGKPSFFYEKFMKMREMSESNEFVRIRYAL
jgi:MoaA/NifB/PqqE/SkfB family radical SAM enzyme